ncbi:MAG TPA: hypothetical protein VF818_04860 [Ktedonobacterales bacterium]
MTKPTITKVWVIGLIVLVAGLIMGGICLGLMFAYGGHFEPSTSGGSEFIPNLDSGFWTMVSLMIVGFSIAAIGGVVQLVAWIGALVNTYQIPDRTWFVVLLAGGLLGFAFGLIGFAAMVAYLIAGPDGMSARHAEMPPLAPRPPTLAPTS